MSTLVVELPDECFVLLIKFLELNEVVSKLLRLNKRLNGIVKSENYLLFKHFLRNFNMMSDRIKRADIVAKVKILELMQENFSLRPAGSLNLFPYSYYTDGGTYNDDTKYFINNIFGKTGVCYSSKVPKNTNIQIYLGREIDADPTKVLPKDYKVKV